MSASIFPTPPPGAPWFDVVVPPYGAAGEDTLVTVQATNWHAALRRALRLTGQRTKLASRARCDVLEDGTLQVTEPDGRVFRLKPKRSPAPKTLLFTQQDVFAALAANVEGPKSAAEEPPVAVGTLLAAEPATPAAEEPAEPVEASAPAAGETAEPAEASDAALDEGGHAEILLEDEIRAEDGAAPEIPTDGRSQDEDPPAPEDPRQNESPFVLLQPEMTATNHPPNEPEHDNDADRSSLEGPIGDDRDLEADGDVDPAQDRRIGPPRLPFAPIAKMPSLDVQHIWFEVARTRAEWRTLAVVAASPGLDTLRVGQALSQMAALDPTTRVLLVNATPKKNAGLSGKLEDVEGDLGGVKRFIDGNYDLIDVSSLGNNDAEVGLIYTPQLLEYLTAPGQPQRYNTVVLALGSMLTQATSIPVARSADKVILCVGLERTSFADARRSIEIIGRERIVGAVAVKPD